jgi:hypothetical protein
MKFLDREGEAPGRGYIGVDNGRVDHPEPGDVKDEVMESNDKLATAYSNGDRAAEELSTPIPDSKGTYRFTAGVQHCKDAPSEGLVPDRDIPADFVNESDIPTEPPFWMGLRDLIVIRPSPSRWFIPGPFMGSSTERFR